MPTNIESSHNSKFTKDRVQVQFSSMVSKIIIVIIFHFLLSSQLSPTKSQKWIKAGYYWHKSMEFPNLDINFSLFTHLICCCANLSSTYMLSFSSPSNENYFSTFADYVKRKNPSVTTLLSIGGPYGNYSIFSTMVSNSSYRKSFIDSSITAARRYGFDGLDFYWTSPATASDIFNLSTLYQEWRVAVSLEAKNSSKSQLILTAVILKSLDSYSKTYPVDTVQQYLNWSHVLTVDYSTPNKQIYFTAAPSALYDPNSIANIDSSIKGWIGAGLSANKLVICLPFYGYAWKLVNSMDNGIGAPAIGPAFSSQSGFMIYNQIKNYIEYYRANVTYNSTYVVNYCTINGTSWFGFDDVEAIRAKVSYAREKGLLGYHVWSVSYDYNSVLSQAAAQEENINSSANQDQDGRSRQNNKQPYPIFLVIILPTTAAAMLLLLVLGLVIYFRWMRKLKSKAIVDSVQESRTQVNIAAAAGDFYANAPTLVLYSLADIEAATDKFSIENKLGEGGYGPVYKGVLQDGREVAVKKLSKTSTQGFEEFKNEVMLTAKLQHVNLVRLLGSCMDREEHMLIYEYMQNKSLDYYLFDPLKKYILDWENRIHIIEGICQGLLYLQEYSRLKIIHRNLKTSNVLLDENMKPKISDFGMARIFTKDGLEANTERIVGTYGYAPPEYVKKGIYSTKSDVYSFGVLLLQIISGKRVSILYGENDHLSLLEYAYELWKDGKGMEFMDPSLDDTYSSCTLIRCLHIALLCVQKIPVERPSMLEVSWMLRNEATDLMIPNMPGFSKQTDEDVQYESTTSNLEIGSVNDTTISNLEAR
ncbi:hypothetical protein Dsin_006031 [Dipteronia sinensis]|uniref:non-specific serine/threonine protein kinase n=1 Tax=Dipteronia sinensis TaxID=43782 RepID=A0AAE0AYX2_9ROSI|nr:hypothetical protein Dsin_006031 [Dipteronia sinensis]